MKILETNRLILRHLEPADLAALFALYQDPEVVRYIPDAPQTLAETKEQLDWYLRGHPRRPELGLWATIYKPTNQFIGRCGLLSCLKKRVGTRLGRFGCMSSTDRFRNVAQTHWVYRGGKERYNCKDRARKNR